MQSDLGLCFDAFVFSNCPRNNIVFFVIETDSDTASIRDLCRKLNDCPLSNTKKIKYNFSRTDFKQDRNRF